MNKDFYISMITKNLSDELSSNEQRDFQDWLSVDDTNQDTFQEYNEVWDASLSYKGSVSFDPRTSFQEFAAKYDIPSSSSSSSDLNQNPITKEKSKILYFGAIFLLMLVIIGTGMFKFSNLFTNIFVGSNSNTVYNSEMQAQTIILDDAVHVTLAPNSRFEKGGRLVVGDKIGNKIELDSNSAKNGSIPSQAIETNSNAVSDIASDSKHSNISIADIDTKSTSLEQYQTVDDQVIDNISSSSGQSIPKNGYDKNNLNDNNLNGNNLNDNSLNDNSKSSNSIYKNSTLPNRNNNTNSTGNNIRHDNTGDLNINSIASDKNSHINRDSKLDNSDRISRNKIKTGSKNWYNTSDNITNENQYDNLSALGNDTDDIYYIENFSGQGYFDVNIPSGESPARIDLEDNRYVEVENATFNLQNYEEDDFSVIDVQTGAIDFIVGENVISVVEGRRLIYNETTGNHKIVKLPAINPFQWHKGVLVFDNTHLQDAFTMIERFYGVNIEVIDDSVLDGHNITATHYKSSNLEDCLELLSEVTPMTILRNDRDIQVSDIKRK